MIQQLTDNFSLAEFLASEVALRQGIDNTPSAEVVDNLRRLARTMETVRGVLGARPIVISSGYRSPRLNAAIGGAPDSAHLEGRAVDFVCPSWGTPKAICQELIIAAVRWDQLIQEGRWVHLAIPRLDQGWRREILTARFSGGKVTYATGLS